MRSKPRLGLVWGAFFVAGLAPAGPTASSDMTATRVAWPGAKLRQQMRQFVTQRAIDLGGADFAKSRIQ